MGRSGSFFFFSHDSRFLIKTMTTDDFNAFIKLLPLYFDHINYFKDSLIARIYGVYQVDMEGMDPCYLLLMGNTKKIDNDYVVKIYDLKGSTSKNRNEKVNEDWVKNTYCLKDHNLMNILKKEILIKFNQTEIKGVLKRMARDLNVLSKLNLMDYSMLFCISFNPKYVELYQDQFDTDRFGALLKPYRLKQKEPVYLNQKSIINEFMDIMTGLNPWELTAYK